MTSKGRRLFQNALRRCLCSSLLRPYAMMIINPGDGAQPECQISLWRDVAWQGTVTCNGTETESWQVAPSFVSKTPSVILRSACRFQCLHDLAFRRTVRQSPYTRSETKGDNAKTPIASFGHRLNNQPDAI